MSSTVDEAQRELADGAAVGQHVDGESPPSLDVDDDLGRIGVAAFVGDHDGRCRLRHVPSTGRASWRS